MHPGPINPARPLLRAGEAKIEASFIILTTTFASALGTEIFGVKA